MIVIDRRRRALIHYATLARASQAMVSAIESWYRTGIANRCIRPFLGGFGLQKIAVFRHSLSGDEQSHCRGQGFDSPQLHQPKHLISPKFSLAPNEAAVKCAGPGLPPGAYFARQ